jgi:NAD(P)-dependent dehydrogenase (short-subunit alcohol dehydrogenase family)
VSLALLNEGASVLACARGEPALAELRELAGEAAGRLHTVAADLGRAEDIERVIAECIRRFGRIDILVNNAGSTRGGGAFIEVEDERWLEGWNLKFFGYVRMARAVYPQMLQQESGVIVNVIGAAAFNPAPFSFIGGTANLALNYFTKALSKEGVHRGIRVVGVNPGPIDTERLEGLLRNRPEGQSREEAMRLMTPMGRPGKPEEVADLVLFLASERAGFISGTSITIDGGNNGSIMG